MNRLLGVLALTVALLATAQADPKPFVVGSMIGIRAAHAGKPYVVALWSVDCPPCHEELAMLGAWRRANPAVALVLISTDTAHAGASVEAMLQQHGLGSIESWIFADEFVERLRHEIDPAWRGELPRSYLVDRHATQAVSGKLTRSQLDAWWR